ncbi:MAG: lysylphosphatidylglycerol synthase domain-containing protein [Chloroflexota bacterium]
MRWGVGAALLIVVLVQVGGGGVLDLLGTADLRIALPAISGLVAVHLLGAATWRLLQSRVSGWAPSWPATIRTYYVAQGIGGLTPANLGSDVYRVAAVRGQLPWSDAALPIVLQRVVSSAALAMLGVVGLTLLPARMPAGVWMAGSVAIVLVVAAAAISLARRQAVSVRAAANGVGMWSVTLASGFGLSLVFHAVSLALGLAIVASIGPVAALLPILGALAVARLSLLVPLTPSGLGVQEGLLAVLFIGIGQPADLAIAASLLARLSLLVTTLIGALLLVSRRSTPFAPSRPPAGGDVLPG